MSSKIDKRREYMRDLMRKKRAEIKLAEPVAEPAIELIEPNPKTIEIQFQLIKKYKKCLVLQQTHGDFMLWITAINLVNEEFLQRTIGNLLAD